MFLFGEMHLDPKWCKTRVTSKAMVDRGGSRKNFRNIFRSLSAKIEQTLADSLRVYQ